MNPNPYFPPQHHDQASVAIPVPQDSPLQLALLEDGYPEDLRQWLFGQDIPETDTTPARHVYGFPHLPRPVAEAWALGKESEGWQPAQWLSSERETWGAGFCLIVSTAGTPCLVVGNGGTPAEPHLVVTAAMPPRVVAWLRETANAVRRGVAPTVAPEPAEPPPHPTHLGYALRAVDVVAGRVPGINTARTIVLLDPHADTDPQSARFDDETGLDYTRQPSVDYLPGTDPRYVLCPPPFALSEETLRELNEAGVRPGEWYYVPEGWPEDGAPFPPVWLG